MGAGREEEPHTEQEGSGAEGGGRRVLAGTPCGQVARRGRGGRLQSFGGTSPTFGLRGPASGLLPSSPIPKPPDLGSSSRAEVGLWRESSSYLLGSQEKAGGPMPGWLGKHTP